MPSEGMVLETLMREDLIEMSNTPTGERPWKRNLE